MRSTRFLAVAAATLALVAGACSSDSKSAATTSAAATSAVTTAVVETTAETTAAPAPTEPVTTQPGITEAPDTTETAEATETTEPPETSEPPETIGAPDTTEAVLSAPFPTQTVEQSFVDASRPTPATASSPEVASRTIATTIVYPQAPGPFPLIVLNHGLTGMPSKLSRISTAWAAAGYVVAMPAFPLTNGSVIDASANVGDVVNQPGDVSFVIDSVLALNGDDSSPLFGRVDAEHIGVAGHSLGSATTYAVALNSCCLDERIDAIVIMAGFVFIAADNDYSRALPVMILHGDADPVLNISLDQGVYDQLAGPKWFVTLFGGMHSTGFEDYNTPHDAVVDRATTDFWNAYLSDRQGATDALRADAVVAGLSTLQTSE